MKWLDLNLPHCCFLFSYLFLFLLFLLSYILFMILFDLFVGLLAIPLLCFATGCSKIYNIHLYLITVHLQMILYHFVYHVRTFSHLLFYYCYVSLLYTLWTYGILLKIDIFILKRVNNGKNVLYISPHISHYWYSWLLCVNSNFYLYYVPSA